MVVCSFQKKKIKSVVQTYVNENNLNTVFKDGKAVTGFGYFVTEID